MSRFIPSLILCVILWLLWSGLFKPLMLAFGAVSCILVAWISSRLNIVDASERPLLIFLRMIPYVPWLIKEVVKSNIDVAKRIWQKDMQISPTIITIPASQKTALGLVIHANSITMTPGTLSIDVEPGEIECMPWPAKHSQTCKTAKWTGGSESWRVNKCLQSP